MYHQMSASIPPEHRKPCFQAVCIHDTDNDALQKYFYYDVSENMIEDVVKMQKAQNKLLQTFVSLRELMKATRYRMTFQLVTTHMKVQKQVMSESITCRKHQKLLHS